MNITTHRVMVQHRTSAKMQTSYKSLKSMFNLSENLREKIDEIMIFLIGIIENYGGLNQLTQLIHTRMRSNKFGDFFDNDRFGFFRSQHLVKCTKIMFPIFGNRQAK